MRFFKKVAEYSLVLAVTILIFNIPATTRQGINGILFVRKIPLYVKTCGFLYRDYQYKALSRHITNGIKGDIDKIKALYDWTIDNIKRKPEGFPVVDDHIWDIIVRRYGASGQMTDVFTTLASYAGYEAFWDILLINNVPGGPILSFVKIGDRWYVFDILNKKSFMIAENSELPTPYGPTYAEYLKTIDKAKFNSCIRRPDKQKISTRLRYEFKKMFSRKDK